MKTVQTPFFAFLLAAALGSTLPASAEMTAEKTMVTVAGEQVEEIMPGMLAGYLSEVEQLDSKLFVLPAPAEDSARQAMDDAWAKELQQMQEGARWDLAIDDADLSFPAAADTFTCALGIEVSEEGTPALYLLLRRTLTDIGLAPYSAKNAYQPSALSWSTIRRSARRRTKRRCAKTAPIPQVTPRSAGDGR